MSKIPDETIVAWDIDLGTTNSTRPQAQHPPHDPEGVSLRQPIPVEEFTGTLLPSVVATYQGARVCRTEGAKDWRY
ncbi:hypothetical protein [Candidatus Nitrotoga arctica]|uniref:Uncharacterized protein n=1 Tax=Candidatus Nitrotoga arctica TaxID=453162 RepID=A0ABM8YVB3_9PROT|nr:hypothetical protein [Candidatus Nitrotoga arctica]CAG9931396.1 protein of unknown function [Candidatus Nitrotoga arctica]